MDLAHLPDQLDELKGIELQLMLALPKLSLAAACGKLEGLFALHLKETEGQADRLAKIARQREREIYGHPSPAMAALIDAAQAIVAHDEPSLGRDVALVRVCQQIEQYEIAAYRAAALVAQRAGEEAVAELLEQTLKEEETAHALLGTVAAEIEAGSIHPESGSG